MYNALEALAGTFAKAWLHYIVQHVLVITVHETIYYNMCNPITSQHELTKKIVL